MSDWLAVFHIKNILVSRNLILKLSRLHAGIASFFELWAESSVWDIILKNIWNMEKCESFLLLTYHKTDHVSLDAAESFSFSIFLWRSIEFLSQSYFQFFDYFFAGIPTSNISGMHWTKLIKKQMDQIFLTTIHRELVTRYTQFLQVSKYLTRYFI